MADNEKLDNQRLKNFKNKGRDLEVKVMQIGVEDLLFSAALLFCSPLASPPGFLVTSFLISTIGNFVLKASAGAFTDRQYNIAGLVWVVGPLVSLVSLHHETALVIKHVRKASQSSSPLLDVLGPTGNMLA